ncbi:unnamed protein product [Nippostrongylus brasiliensis]|uniref:Metalloprotease TIKI homolog n=1 Tax=Nippostrongylus brasiliensis TaxID=27835 RepID=A0A0N4XLI0_NIPBR|nr:unnamed protein product [Nippostrongylus brasiliensis]
MPFCIFSVLPRTNIRNWDRKRPEWLLFALYQLCEDFVNRPTSPMLDVFLANKAYQEEKQIRAIETAHEQCNPVASLSQEEVIEKILFYSNWYTTFSLDRHFGISHVFQSLKSGKYFGDSQRCHLHPAEVNSEGKKESRADAVNFV